LAPVVQRERERDHTVFHGGCNDSLVCLKLRIIMTL
jgi:hypothetical protein